MMTEPVDTIELIQVVSALLATLFTMRAVHTCYADLKEFTSNRPDLRPIAIRRIRQQTLLLLLALAFLVSGVISATLTIGPTQSAVRTFTLVIAALIVFIFSLTDHLEAARLADLDRRRNRRVSDPPLSERSEPGDRRGSSED